MRRLSPRSAGLRFVALLALVTVLVVGALTVGPDRQSLLRLGSFGGPLAPLLAIGASAVLAAAVVPRTLLALVGGAIFGWLSGAAYSLVGVTLGASLAFVVGRLLGRAFLVDRLRSRSRGKRESRLRDRLQDSIAMVELAVSRRGTLAVALARLIPIVPFGVSNYAFGASAVRPDQFVLGTLAGATPTTLAYAALGAATVQQNATGIAVAGIAATMLGLGGSCGTYIVWRWLRRG